MKAAGGTIMDAFTIKKVLYFFPITLAVLQAIKRYSAAL